MNSDLRIVTQDFTQANLTIFVTLEEKEPNNIQIKLSKIVFEIAKVKVQ